MKIAILTNLRGWNDAYSLCHVIRAQIAMLKRYGHDCCVFVSEDATPAAFPWNVPVEPFVPVVSGLAYQSIDDLDPSDTDLAQSLAERLSERLKDFDIVFTHDWIFGRKMPALAEALRLCADLTRHLPFYHYVHSVAMGHMDWWDLNRYGENHTIIYPSAVHGSHTARAFNTDISRVVPIPHIVDLRLMHEYSAVARAIIDDSPALMQAEFVQVYAAAADRLFHKGLHHLIKVFGALKTYGSVALLVVDSLSGGGGPRNSLEHYEEMAALAGLELGNEFNFVSKLHSGLNYLPHKSLMELMQLGNVFVFPSRGEAFGLCAVEALLCGAAVPVINGCWSQMQEVVNGDFVSKEAFGSPYVETQYSDYAGAARRLASTCRQDESWQPRTYARQEFNMDTVYRKYYEPILKGPACQANH